MKAMDTAMEKVLVKLNDMLGKKFSVNVEYFPLYGTPKAQMAPLETVKRNAGAPMIVSHNELIVPLRVEGVLTGAARVTPINKLQPGEIGQIKDTIDLILAGVLAAQHRLDILTMTEEVLRNHSDSDNVISLKDHRLREVANH